MKDNLFMNLSEPLREEIMGRARAQKHIKSIKGLINASAELYQKGYILEAGFNLGMAWRSCEGLKQDSPEDPSGRYERLQSWVYALADAVSSQGISPHEM